MALYRKKPVVIEARVLRGGHTHARLLAEWCGGYVVSSVEGPWSDIKIPTLEGEMLAKAGDYIIKGVQGEFYPCRPDIFTATYEEVRS